MQPSLSERAYSDIKQKIVSLTLSPGSVISEGTLQEELGFGRTPIREALQRLSLEKLVTILPRRGMFVADIGITDLPKLFEVRVVLESLAARLAAKRGRPGQWQRMEAVLEQLPPPTHPSYNEALIWIDQSCHEILYEAADNPFLADTLTTHYALSLRLWYFFLGEIGDMRGAVLEHRQILEALKEREEQEAARLMGQHIQAFQEEIQAVMLGEIRSPGTL
jgi:DNA-binding GntR family transcriptional regulator